MSNDSVQQTWKCWIGGDETDIFTGVAYLDEFDIHYPVNTVGSSEEYTK